MAWYEEKVAFVLTAVTDGTTESRFLRVDAAEIVSTLPTRRTPPCVSVCWVGLLRLATHVRNVR